MPAAHPPAPPPSPIASALAEEARGYSLLAIARENGARAVRFRHCEATLRDLTGAEAAVVVNGGGAALFLALTAMRAAAGRPGLLVARRHLVDLADGLAAPALARFAGLDLVETGAADRTRLSDYEEALTPGVGVVLEAAPPGPPGVEPPLSELAELAHERGAILVSAPPDGGLADLAPYGGPALRPAGDALAAGADLAVLSTERAGGPRAGLVLGRRDLTARLHADPLYRAVRTGKLTLLALEEHLAELLDLPRAAARARPV